MACPARRLMLLFVLALLLPGLAACTSRTYEDARFAQSFSQPYTLDSGDRLRIIVFGQENLSNIYGVDDGGMVAMPLIGAVQARGRTPEQLRQSISARLGAQYLRDPNVSVEIERYRPFFALGEVNAAGQFSYVSDMTGETAVAIAGGFSSRARKDVMVISRKVDGVVTSRQVPINHPVMPGDTVYILERWF